MAGFRISEEMQLCTQLWRGSGKESSLWASSVFLWTVVLDWIKQGEGKPAVCGHSVSNRLPPLLATLPSRTGETLAPQPRSSDKSFLPRTAFVKNCVLEMGKGNKYLSSSWFYLIFRNPDSTGEREHGRFVFLSSCIWFDIRLSSSLHFPGHDIIPVSFRMDNIIHYIHHIDFIRSFLNGYLDQFHVSTVLRSAAVIEEVKFCMPP